MIKNLEFLRIVCCLAIIFCHFFNSAGIYAIAPDVHIFHKLFKTTANSYMAVELFFILSGLFFAIKLDLTRSLWDFFKYKFIRLYPVAIFAMAVAFIMHFFSSYLNFNIYNALMNLFGILGTGLTSIYVARFEVNVFWYVTALLAVLSFFYYLLKNYEKKDANLIIAILVFLSLQFLVNNETWRHYDANLLFNTRTARAISAIGIGYFIGEWFKINYDKIIKQKFSVGIKLFFTVIEFLCVFFIINNFFLHKIKYSNNIIFILTFTITVMLFLLKQGYISSLLEKIQWRVLSKYTFSIYIFHGLILDTIKLVFWKNNVAFVIAHPLINIVAVLLIMFTVGVLVYHFVEIPLTKYLKEKFL